LVAIFLIGCEDPEQGGRIPHSDKHPHHYYMELMVCVFDLDGN
jgi:hypothetical protein